MRSDKYNNSNSSNRDSSRDTRQYDGWEEVQKVFQARDQQRMREKQHEEWERRRQKDEAYQEYLAMRQDPNANYSADTRRSGRQQSDAQQGWEEDVKPYYRQRSQQRQQAQQPLQSRRKRPILEPARDDDDDDFAPTSRKAKKQQKQQNKQYGKGKKKKLRRGKRIALLIVLILAALIVAGTLFVMGMVGRVGSLEINQSDLGIDPQVAADLKDYRNIVLLGVDARDMDDYENCRTDAMIILSVDKAKKDIRQISIFRDTYMFVDDKYGYDKITNVHALEGTTATLRTLNQNMDLNISETVVVNWKAVADAVDGLGGIDVEIQDSEINEMNKYIKDTQKNIGGSKDPIDHAGMQTLNGNQAVTYARIRKDSARGDYRRNERMKIVVSAAVEKAKKTNPFTLNRIANQVLPEIKTNMSTNDLLGVMLSFVRGNMTDSVGWPFETDGWINYNGAWCGVPVTLSRNVTELHEKYFGQSGYEPTQKVQDISAEISRRTGRY